MLLLVINLEIVILILITSWILKFRFRITNYFLNFFVFGVFCVSGRLSVPDLISFRFFNRLFNAELLEETMLFIDSKHLLIRN